MKIFGEPMKSFISNRSYQRIKNILIIGKVKGKIFDIIFSIIMAVYKTWPGLYIHKTRPRPIFFCQKLVNKIRPTSYILCNIDSFGCWTLEKYKLYNSFSGLTTNLSEGMNNLLKLLIERTAEP